MGGGDSVECSTDVVPNVDSLVAIGGTVVSSLTPCPKVVVVVTISEPGFVEKYRFDIDAIDAGGIVNGRTLHDLRDLCVLIEGDDGIIMTFCNLRSTNARVEKRSGRQ